MPNESALKGLHDSFIAQAFCLSEAGVLLFTKIAFNFIQICGRIGT
jgi:hypothetical protein